MKKVLALLLAAVMMTFAFVSCENGTPAETNPEPESTRVVEIQSPEAEASDANDPKTELANSNKEDRHPAWLDSLLQKIFNKNRAPEEAEIPGDAVAAIDSVYYDSLEDAISAAQDGETIYILKDCDDENVVVAREVFFMINSQGYAFNISAGEGYTMRTSGNPATDYMSAFSFTVDNSFVAYDRVIIIGVDGGGAFFKEADTPNLDKIFEKGAVTYTMQTSNPSISAQSWGALLHGVKPEFHRLTNSIVSSTPYDTDSPYPSFFRVVKEAMPNATLASFCTWNPINVGIIEEGLGVTKGTDGSDAVLTTKIVNYLDSNDPTVLFVQFDNVDGAGHGSGYGSQRHLDQIELTDGYIGQIYDKLEEEGLLENALFIVTADHGGTPQGGHGGDSVAEMNIMFAVAGKTVVNGGKVTSKDEDGNPDNAQIRDIAAVVTYAFGLEAPKTWTGTVPGDTFVGVDAVIRPESKIVYEHEHRTHESTPTPSKNSGKYITDVLGRNRVKAYLTFDNTIADAMGHSTSMKADGKIYYVDGFYGKGAQLSETYVEIEGVNPSKNSFTVAMWIKTGGVNSDPCLISNKDWRNGSNPGFVLSLRENDIKYNLGNGQSRADTEWQLPFDYRDGWVHIIFSVDRAKNKVYFSYDFGAMAEADIPTSLANASFDGISNLIIGQDGTKNYDAALSAVVDDVIIIDGVFTADDVAALAEYYGINK